jgi:hypothetical protein
MTRTEMEALAARIRLIAADAPKAALVGRKIWIHAAWALGQFEVSLDGFKAALVEMNRLGLLSLSRCDLVEAFDPYDVKRSRVEHMGATFNLIRF